MTTVSRRAGARLGADTVTVGAGRAPRSGTDEIVVTMPLADRACHRGTGRLDVHRPARTTLTVRPI